ncbi:DUF5693 family protein [Pectinatus haikarae]|uniref:DUF5693 family protein n=1 Tax=Pectinatus haikarae TaxID=349096 RepID=UPI0018C83EA5|nr:DUF5693 family protein [Pectinatus haikarae]
MRVFNYNRWFILLIAIGLVAGLVISFQRYHVESSNATIELALDYEDLLKLAENEGLPPSEVLAETKKAGITSLAVYETTFKKLNENGKAAATSGSEILQRYHNGSLSDPDWSALVSAGKIVGTDVYVTGNDPQTFKEVKEDLLLRLGNERVRTLSVGSSEVLAVKANYENFLKMNLGMPTDEMKAVNAAGFYVIARPSNYTDVTEKEIDAVFDRLNGIKISDIVFSGPQTLGAPKLLNYTVEKMKQRDITLGMIENVSQLKFYPQDGLVDIAQGLDYKAARLYTIPKDEQPKMKLADAVERWSNTDEERNIRIDLLRPYEKPATGLSVMQTNIKYFADTRDKLEAKGFEIGPAGSLEIYDGSQLLRIFIMIGICAAGVLYLSLIIPDFKLKYQYMLFVLITLICVIPLAMGHGNKIRVLGAFAAANLFPTLAMIYLLDKMKDIKRSKNSSFLRIMLLSFGMIIVTSAISLIGAAYLSGILSDVRYFLEIEIFRGIKLTFVLPMILVGIALCQRFNVFDDDNPLVPMNIIEQIKHFLNMKILVKTLMIFVMLALAMVVFIERSGHTAGFPVPGIELKIRAILEKTFFARPRSKELFIGHPAFFIMVMAWLRKWPVFIFGILVFAATIGQGSMVETFAHMRTPVYMSLVRGVGGVVFGALLGFLVLLILELWRHFSSVLERRKNAGHE